MKLFLPYLKMKIREIFMFIFFMGIFILIGFLYSVPSEGIVYTLVLCTAAGLAAIVFGFISFLKKHSELKFIAQNICEEIDRLPQPENISEENYTAIINALRAEITEIKTKNAAASRDINDYYTLWVHQIKTPIAALNLLLQEKDEPEMSEQLFRIEQYVEMVLTYIRTQNDSSDYVLKKCSLDSIVKASVKKYAKSFIRKKIAINYSETDIWVLTDEKWMSFAIEQILGNALKYTQTGSVTIKVSENKLSISDTGIGIAPEDLPRICEKGYTGYNGREDKKSTGIGLFLTKNILTKLGHRLEIKSEIGKGTTAEIVFIESGIGFE